MPSGDAWVLNDVPRTYKDDVFEELMACVKFPPLLASGLKYLLLPLSLRCAYFLILQSRDRRLFFMIPSSKLCLAPQPCYHSHKNLMRNQSGPRAYFPITPWIRNEIHQ